MSKALVIVESPAKVKTINKFLGKNFTVKSSIGHIRDLATGKADAKPSKGKKAKSSVKTEDKRLLEYTKLCERMGVDPENGWQARYEIVPGKEKVLSALKEAAAKADEIYLATDLDREGEAIAWHLTEAIGADKSKYKRVTFTEITKKAVKEAFAKPSTLNMDRVNAQQARRFLDRVVGFMLSPLLWQKVARGLSAGRVQSVAVRLIAEREKEIHAFKVEEYWEVHADVAGKNGQLRMEVVKENGSAFRPSTEKAAMISVEQLRKEIFRVSQIEKKAAKLKAGAPYITSTLQQAASQRLGFGVKKTMMLAQRLYEAGYITYMRTDSTNLSKDAVASCRDFIKAQWGGKYLPEAENTFSSKKSAQEAHEAIRPTDVLLRKDDLPSTVEKDALRLYDIIWRQFVACQMAAAEFDSTVLTVNAGNFELKARGRVLRFDGHLRVQPQSGKRKEDEVILPELSDKETLRCEEVVPSQHFTKPPPRYTESGLVRELEKRGIGRPSTYAAIISTIQERGYAKVERKRFFCLKMGEIVTDRLVENFDDLMDYGFTASMEEYLDQVAAGTADWKAVLDKFYRDFVKKLETASSEMRGNPPTEIDYPCPECKRPMTVRTARTGVFLSCSGYALPPKERCKGTINLVPGDDFALVGEGDEDLAQEHKAKERCHLCDTVMDSYIIDSTHMIHVCGNNPECSGTRIQKGTFKVKGYEGPLITCDKCGKDMQLKSGRFGKYFGCTGAPECKNTRKLMRNGEAAPPRADPIHMPELPCSDSNGYFVLRDGAAGLFLASSLFPRSRETRKPRVEDLVRHKDKLDPKHHALLKAPVRDPEGNPTLIRFSRKSKEHFITSEKDGKATSWALFWQNGKWVEGKEGDA